MYIQEDRSGLPFTVPRGYSGSAFAEAVRETAAPTTEEAPEPQAEATPTTPTPQEDSTPTAEPIKDTPVGLFGKFPFLSSLLPPPRKKGENGLPEWALLAIIFFLLNDSREGDLLPILLLLLLWD